MKTLTRDGLLLVDLALMGLKLHESEPNLIASRPKRDNNSL